VLVVLADTLHGQITIGAAAALAEVAWSWRRAIRRASCWLDIVMRDERGPQRHLADDLSIGVPKTPHPARTPATANLHTATVRTNWSAGPRPRPGSTKARPQGPA
jgi:hypothetical protein